MMYSIMRSNILILKQRKLSTTNFCHSFILKMFLIIQLTTVSIQSELNQQELVRKSQDLSELNDPIVWDSKSLYPAQNTIRSHLFRNKRSPSPSAVAHTQSSFTNQLVDACQSRMEVITPYYATNSKGKVRIVVNSELMQQAIQIETCSRTPQTTSSHHNQNTNENGGKCNSQIDCGCEQKYKWHRLLVLDSKDSEGSKGLFMDWFLFPSSCVCRCKSSSPQKFSLKHQQPIKR